MAIEYGMSTEEFWKDDPQLFVSYRTSFINKKKREMEELDYKCWLNGLYTYDGNSKISARLQQTISNGFASLGKSPHFDRREIPNYTEKPFTELEKEKSNVKQKEQDNKEKNREALICQGSIKHIYLEKIKRQNEGK